MKREDSLTYTKTRENGKEYVVISYLFVAIFVSLVGYLVYFNVKLKDDIMNSPYNTRQNSAAEYVIRGNIESLDGETLAYTDVSEDGSETRVYPYKDIFAHVVGYFDNGKSGLESLANYQLLSSHSFIVEQIMDELQNKKKDGDTVVTTLDASLQVAAYNALGDYNGAVVVLEPSTGRILAMVSKPDFDPNTLSANWDDIVNDENSSVLVNRATQGQYAPGSTFKIVTALAYYRQHGSFDGFHFECDGAITLDEHTIHCYNNSVHGSEDFITAFAKSCNSAFAQIGNEIGADTLRKTSEDLLFNNKLSIPLNYKKSSFTLNKDDGTADLMQTAIGQGDTLVSPMHMAMIVSAIANEGTLMEPYLIDHVENKNGDIVSTTSSKAGPVLMTNIEAAQIGDLMEAVVSSGTASKLLGNGYSVAGKTGSAEFFREDGSIGTHSWFVGYSNVDDPDIVVCVLGENAGTGSSFAVPAAKQIFDEYYY